MEIEVKPMLKYYLIFKILLFQSIFINAQDSTADYRSSQLEQRSLLMGILMYL